jgi:hypothetical protein
MLTKYHDHNMSNSNQAATELANQARINDFHKNIARCGNGRTHKNAYVRLLFSAMQTSQFQEELDKEVADSLFMIYINLDMIEQEEIRQFGKSE